jgi:para-nitrobenzyl esterase
MDHRADIIEPVTVETGQGRLAGQRLGETLEFRGIPFAAPPVGPLRWRMPEAAPAWAGVRDATRFGPVCPQAPTPFDLLLGGALSSQSEDCLYLNVWTPSCDGLRRPVMVWLHGGAFVIGAGSQVIYDGTHLAQRDVVVVTINYRLGVFGFLNLSDASEGRAPGTGAEGVADQLLALDWVKRHIAAFGGDPDNVTLFGESAGAMSIGALLGSPLAGGAFRKAILQSGASHIGYDRARSARVARAVLDVLQIAPGDEAQALDVPAAALVKAQLSVVAAAHGGNDSRGLGSLPFQPTIDGAILRERPIDAVRGGSARGVALLTGTTREEWKLFTAADPRLRLMSAASFEARVKRYDETAAPRIVEAYDDGAPFERFNAFMTDKTFTVPVMRLLEAQAAFAPTYAYRFDWRSPLLGGVMGSCHAIDIGFTFGTHANGAASAFFGRGANADALAQAVMDCWTSFARSGNPSTDTTGTWPPFEPNAQATMIFGVDQPHLAQAPHRERLAAWTDFPERRLGP